MPNAVVVIPDQLLHWIADFGGTVVDLLYLIDVFPRLATSVNLTNEEGFNFLYAITQKYVEESLDIADRHRQYLSGSREEDYAFLWTYLSRMRNAPVEKKSEGLQRGGEILSGLFDDMTLRDYAALVTCAAKVIDMSEPPDFKKWAVLNTIGTHYVFVVCTVNIGSSNTSKVFETAVEACKNKNGEHKAVLVAYANIANANDYRSPMLIALPPALPGKHWAILMENIVNKSTQSF